ncbi:uncharacterized protein LOC128230967 [Mya arenaria]|uniref:uncharacterized protein LOC128230967 n=1 Tax=Mya arenaria TaxID=6604 RepID=UPI0022E517DB|nr:uncharacterized protein LOC128230967 [Mya arenaria]
MALVLGWKQELIHWNESDFGGAKQLVFDARQIWTPDINFNNRVDYGNIITDDADKSFKVTLYDDGNVIWIIGDQLETSCNVDISWYPFDNQTCILEIATVTSTDPEIQLIPAAQFVHINLEVPNTEWTIHESPIYKTARHTDRSVLKVHILLSRKVLSHIMNTIIPVFILSFMNVLSFKIPLQSGERISYSVSLFLTFMVLLDMISDSIPNVSSQVSGLQLFVTLQLAFGAVVTTLSIALVKWSHSFSNQRDGGRFSIKCLKGLCTTKTEINDLDESEDGNQEKGVDVLIELKELNAKDQTLKTSMALFLRWKQDLLRWNNSDFGGAGKITLDSRELWTPDVNFDNRVDFGNILTNDADNSYKVTLYADGNVIWIIGGQLETPCTVDISWYPFDNQRCIIEIATVTSTDPELQLIPATRLAYTVGVGSNSEWTILDSPIYQNSYFTEKSFLEVHIVLTRKPLSYIMNTIIPVFILSFMNVLSFKIPLQSGERISYSVSLFLSFMVLLTMISDSIPVSSQVSGLQLFVTLQLAFGAVVTSLSIAMVKLSFANQRDNSKSLNGCLKGLCTKTPKTHDCNATDDGETQNENVSVMKKNQCFDTIDCVLFWIFLALFLLAVLILVIVSS